MSLCLVLHDLGDAPAAAEKVFFEAIYEIAPEHWPITPRAVLVATGVSPAYLRDHLLRALKKQEAPDVVLTITRVSPDAAWHNLPAEGEEWLRRVLED
ncbi:hypothetical protein JMJ55_19250 [Belnapia sp. T6]|uniref:Uncharacterized protein n=1 Tax=Belnapia mucosa TaxID=2804532 RepID=A0ABS1V725_9PROT|nr:hypothetical protein [Belnapia mucosa]MBL6457473.1 hypothetical protein [Belnapia mucosa]